MNMYSVMLSAQSAAAAGVIDANQPIKNRGVGDRQGDIS